MQELVGKTLGQYRVLELIGMGGMARVYKGYQPNLDRHVAIKAIPTRVESALDRSLVQRFNSEARMVARLTHPHIVPVHDFGEDDDWAYIVMEYIGNGTVRERQAHAETTRTRLPLYWVLKLCEQAANALDFAHSNGIIHRDVKPGNMLLRHDEHLLLSDFGIATILAASAVHTREGNAVGTPQYMAPEQGTPNAPVDGRADIYSLGVVLYQCVTNRLPFYADSPSGIIAKHISEAPQRPLAFVPDLPPVVEQIILTAMAKDPRARYQRGVEMAIALRDARAGLRQTARVAVVPSPATAVVAAVGPGHAPVAAPAAAPQHAPPQGAPGAPGTCFRCGAANNPANRYCTSCGYDLTGARGRADTVFGPNGRPLRCRLWFRNGPLTGRAFTLHQDTTTIGRIAGNDIIILDGTVSRRHARLVFQAGQWVVEDLNSSNGTFVNGQRVARTAMLRHGDEVRMGDDVLSFEIVC